MGVILLILVGLVYRTYAIYQEKQDFNVIKGSVPEYMSDYDVHLALTIDGQASTTFPEKGSGKTVESIVCDKDAKGYWDYENWRL